MKRRLANSILILMVRLTHHPDSQLRPSGRISTSASQQSRNQLERPSPQKRDSSSSRLCSRTKKMNRLDRLTAILLLLQGGKRTAGEIAEP
jgi:hypothetical protein